MDISRLERDVRVLKLYSLGMTFVVVVLALSAFRQRQSTGSDEKVKFTEIDVERINIVEPNGKYRLVLSNRPRSIGPIYKGQPFGYPGGGRPGMIWFNDEGTENGGFGFSGARCETGTSTVDGRPCVKGTYEAVTHFTFDQFDQDQIFVMNYSDRNGQREVGITINDRNEANIFDLVKQRDSLNKLPNTPERNAALKTLLEGTPDNPSAAKRLFIGRDAAKNATLNLRDKFGKSRLRLVVDSLGGARIEFLDDQGKVTNTITGKPD
jgi:hypothetical protein